MRVTGEGENKKLVRVARGGGGGAAAMGAGLARKSPMPSGGLPKQTPGEGMEKGMILAKPTFSQQRLLRKMVVTTLEQRTPVRLTVSVDAATGHFPLESPVWIIRLGVQKYMVNVLQG